VNVGLLFSFRNPSAWRRPFTAVYADELTLISDAEALGYETVWLTEHHFADDGYSPSVLALAANIAGRTERVRIGTNLLLLPLHNAVRVAEDTATVDILSNGRLDVGLGQGYAVHEFLGYGIPRGERRSRFVEGIDVLRGLWTEPTFSYEGRHYEIDDAQLSPRPVQQPHPPLWIGATSEAGVARAGRLGAHLLGLASPSLQRVYDDALLAAGHDPRAAHVLQLHWVHVAPTTDEAWAAAAPHFHYTLTTYAEWARLSGDAAEGTARTDVPPVDELRSTKRALMFRPVFGAPEDVATMLRWSMSKVRTTHLCLAMAIPGMDPALVRRSMQLFIREVQPMLDLDS
jgi:alkanesulfonate monooxygenase SsuD/methylene tetrahydromethanopterin reductase-like flavin-dependent oxidoreductase (luciferase family)